MAVGSYIGQNRATDANAKSVLPFFIVIPAKAGIAREIMRVDARSPSFRWGDGQHDMSNHYFFALIIYSDNALICSSEKMPPKLGMSPRPSLTVLRIRSTVRCLLPSNDGA